MTLTREALAALKARMYQIALAFKHWDMLKFERDVTLTCEHQFKNQLPLVVIIDKSDTISGKEEIIRFRESDFEL